MLLRAGGRAQAGPAGIVSLAQVPRLEVGLEDLGVEGPAGGVSRFETPPRQRPDCLLFSGFRLLHPPGADLSAAYRESPDSTQAVWTRRRHLEYTAEFAVVATPRPLFGEIRLTLYTRGFSHFFTSMTAPVASGWSDGRVGFAPTGKAPPYHGTHPHPTLGHRHLVCFRLVSHLLQS